MEFNKSMAKYYIHWFQDCHKSAIYCKEHGDDIRARKYLDDASKYLTIIMENWEAIEYFSVGDRFALYDSVHPEQFRGYK